MATDGSLSNQSPRALPTYALAPTRKYDFSRAHKLLQAELNRRCNKVAKTVTYESKFVADFARDLGQQLRRIIKQDPIHSARYKLILLVTLLQIKPDHQTPQAMVMASRCLWNRETDGSLVVQCKLGDDMVALVTAFAVYTD
jgi:hypothetical protein